jgi:hypothetical protein
MAATDCRPEQKKPPRGWQRWCHALRLLCGAASGIFDIASHSVRRSLGLIELPFSLEALIASYLASGILDGALHLVSSALHMFAIHVLLLFVAGYAQSTAQGTKPFGITDM